MKRLFLLTLLVCLFPAGLFAQKPVKNYEELLQLFSDAGLSAEIRKETIRVAIPDTKWELYAYLTARNSKVWLSFTCQPLPKDAPMDKVRELLEASDDGITGCYFSVNNKRQNIYINLMLDNRAITAEVLREKINTIADFAIKHTKLWDPANWGTKTAGNTPAPTKEEKPVAPPTIDMPKLNGKWTLSVEEKELTVTGNLLLGDDGKYFMQLADKEGKQTMMLEGEWKQEGDSLLMTSKTGKTNTFKMIASITGSKTEYQFQSQTHGQAKMTLSRQ